MGRVLHIGRPYGVYRPDYRLAFWHNGDPRRPVGADQLNLGMVTAIQTAKNLTDLSGTWTVTIKDRRAKRRLREMDTVRIQLSGHANQQLTTVMKGVVDNVRPAGSADPYAAREDTIIEGRCMGKYLQVASLFLPVWDPDGNLPTALTFGLGDVTKKGSPTYKAGGLGPYDIFGYLVRNYLYGGKGTVGTSGIPSSRHWVDYKSRFSRSLGFQIPFLQFDEDALAMALQQMAVTGFTEAWMDEVGRIVYRKPQWDAPARYSIHTDALQDWDFPRGDVDVATYVEVIPAGDPGIDSSIAQALRAGRAPVPSSYVKTGGKRTQLGKAVSDEFIIDTDQAGKPTKQGRKSPWWQLQQRLGIRPQQITSPLLVDQEQAQAQAEGLLRFATRYTKAITVTIPGEPGVRLGHTARVHGELEFEAFDRSGYIEQVTHDYVQTPDGGSYTTSVTCTHGRDARDPFTGKPDPKWGAIAIPKFDPGELAASGGGGVLGPAGGAGKRTAAALIAGCQKVDDGHYPYVWGGGHAHAGTPDRGTGRDPGIGYDCSGSVGAALAFAGMGYKVGQSVPASGSFETWGAAGRGDTHTVWANSGHIFIELHVPGHDARSFDTRNTDGAGYGPRLRTVLGSTQGFVPRHWPGL